MVHNVAFFERVALLRIERASLLGLYWGIYYTIGVFIYILYIYIYIYLYLYIFIYFIYILYIYLYLLHYWGIYYTTAPIAFRMHSVQSHSSSNTHKHACTYLYMKENSCLNSE